MDNNGGLAIFLGGCAFIAVNLIAIILVVVINSCSCEKCEQEKHSLIQPPNYDKESLLELLKKGECGGGTIDEGRFSVFVCKE